MRRACIASFVILLAAPAFAQPAVTPVPTPKHRGKKAPATPAAGATTPAGTHGNAFVPPSSDVQPTTTHQEGEYSGVTPGEAPKPDHPKPKRTPPKGTLSWLGFEAKDGGAQLFFQSIAPFELTQDVENGVLVVHMAGLKALGANVGRAIDTRFFDNPLARVEARHVGAAGASKNGPAHPAGIEVRVTFKNVKDAHEGTLKSGQEADGYYYVYLSFPEGADQKAPATAEPEK